jgi:hypothetical protein
MVAMVAVVDTFILWVIKDFGPCFSLKFARHIKAGYGGDGSGDKY